MTSGGRAVTRSDPGSSGSASTASGDWCAAAWTAHRPRPTGANSSIIRSHPGIVQRSAPASGSANNPPSSSTVATAVGPGPAVESNRSPTGEDSTNCTALSPWGGGRIDPTPPSPPLAGRQYRYGAPRLPCPVRATHPRARSAPSASATRCWDRPVAAASSFWVSPGGSLDSAPSTCRSRSSADTSRGEPSAA
jgi:hypothetical protein